MSQFSQSAEKTDVAISLFGNFTRASGCTFNSAKILLISIGSFLGKIAIESPHSYVRSLFDISNAKSWTFLSLCSPDTLMRDFKRAGN